MRQLVVRLRELRDTAGIGASALARKTTYSRSSWNRYLNGRTMPPRRAVEELGRLAGADLPRLLALWELAEWGRAESPPPQPADEPVASGPEDAPSEPEGTPSGRPPRFRRRWVLVAASGLAVLAAAGAAAWLTGLGSPGHSRPSVRPEGLGCDYSRRDGRLYAGHSTTSDRLVALHGDGEDVVEVQCLLARHGFDPGRIDGLFGTRTEAAVKRLQQAGGVPADGIVGPQTWPLLRA
ncbi:peptidoglycan-binding protein [Gandjariella thermophila]|uniref:peptidoglycan-binding protein n=1 Tax=Gandjariella thermophila TaxID=1931992 RepID=UPI001CEF827D|nr:peptidoglycan-binding protein [Gandjariella thermophila]